MTFRSVGSDNDDLIRKLRGLGTIASESVAQAMIKTDRKYYCPQNPYIDAAQPIGHDVTISAPHMHAFALEKLRGHLKPGARVLDVGSGSGYLTACFLRNIREKGDDPNIKVVGIEHRPELVQQSKKNLNTDDPKMLDSGKLIIVVGDGRKGVPEHAPYDVIHVGAATAVVPIQLLNQLANGGRLIVPIGSEGGDQYMTQYDKDNEGKIKQISHKRVRFGPLTDLHTVCQPLFYNFACGPSRFP